MFQLPHHLFSSPNNLTKMTDTASIIVRANRLPLELRTEIYSQLFHVTLEPLLNSHSEREWVKRTSLPSLEVCRRDETYKSFRAQCAKTTGAWWDDVEEAFFKGTAPCLLYSS